MRKEPLFHAAQKHQRKLKALGGVQAHELHTVFPFGRLAFAGLKRRMGKKVRELIDLVILTCF